MRFYKEMRSEEKQHQTSLSVPMDITVSEGGCENDHEKRAGNPRGDDTTAPLKSSSDYKPLMQQTFPKHQGAHSIKR